ncbi:protein phosphatase regulator [Friedmanniomyces endolithicus]|nr:protein phosphatase regulator [Friedmanniomyces endolithicus]KAK0334877.1 protein phosphatase regulator [Friedmanniomyces endolithicus]KAK0771899.1 protein phosphatase regulator [Friedmanniomyces endolithicus]KAK0778061.1 protein phosphatase regulator [Friedmanniomyces endolithicus]KAK0819858.1 protein phosphatase regulator [Friedmanniomyces endolithicus]
MAEVLTAPPSPDIFFQPSGLRRAHASSTSLYIGPSGLPPSASSSYLDTAAHQDRAPSPPSISIPSPPSTTPASASAFEPQGIPIHSTSSLEAKFGSDDDISFPDYGQFYQQSSVYAESQSSEEPVESVTTETTASDSPLPTPSISDDTALKQEPSQHVDYLSHEWREEDIWSSWRHIVSQRKVYGQKSRLENASWRTWAKSKYHLPTISPETLNWLKESDVTWLYGPLKQAESHPVTSEYSEPTSHLSKSNSFISKKPILKKRSMSEVMLQRSISTSSLVSQAAAAVYAQQSKESRRSVLLRTQSDYVSFKSQPEAPSRDPIDYFTSRSSSGNSTPGGYHAKRHIRFSDRVKECRALESKEDPDEGLESESDEELHQTESSESSSDDGVILMKRMRRTSRKRNIDGSRSSSHNGRKMIETLPDTTLKYKADGPDVSETQQHHTFGQRWGSSRLSPSPSQETLRPSHPSSNFLLGDQEEGGELDTSSTWSFGASNPKSSLGAASPTEEPERGIRRDNFTTSRARAATPAPDDFKDGDLRRTNSGMLMPYDEDDEDDAMAVGLFGRLRRRPGDRQFRVSWIYWMIYGTVVLRRGRSTGILRQLLSTGTICLGAVEEVH